MISKGLYDYLTDSRELSGHPATAFARPQTIPGTGITLIDRNDARKQIRDRVGRQIYLGRLPRGQSPHTWMSIVEEPILSDQTLSGETEQARALIQVDVFTQGVDAAMRAMVIKELLRIAVAGWHADYWGDVVVVGCAVPRITKLTESPIRGDDWVHRYSMDLDVQYVQAAAVYQ